MSASRAGILLLVACSACATFQSTRPLESAAESRTTHHSLVVGRTTRTFYLHLPRGLSTSQRYPLVILLHGHNNNGASVLHQSKLDAVADRNGFIVAAPNGTGRFGRFGLTWNVGTCCGSAQKKHVDDVGFLAALIDTLARALPIDRARIVIAGFSAGGMLALRAACDRAWLAAAYVNVQGTMPDTSCAPSHPVSMLLIAGDEDEDMREEHAENAQRHGHSFATSALGTLRFWATHNECDSTVVTRQTHDLTERSGTGCASGALTRLVTVHGHPHAWPGGHRTWRFAPTPNRNVDASLLIAEFLREVSSEKRASTDVCIPFSFKGLRRDAEFSASRKAGTTHALPMVVAPFSFRPPALGSFPARGVLSAPTARLAPSALLLLVPPEGARRRFRLRLRSRCGPARSRGSGREGLHWIVNRLPGSASPRPP